jgi:hypothetical protein
MIPPVIPGYIERGAKCQAPISKHHILRRTDKQFSPYLRGSRMARDGSAGRRRGIVGGGRGGGEGCGEGVGEIRVPGAWISFITASFFVGHVNRHISPLWRKIAYVINAA